KYLVYLILLSMSLVPTINILAQSKTAQFIGHSKSIYLGEVTASFADIGKVDLVFTTPDGSGSKFPLFQDLGNSMLFSGEARPVSTGSRSFETDYAMYSHLAGQWIEYGRAVLDLPNSDSDKNGLFDIIQYNKSAKFSTTGTGYVHAPAPETTKLTGTFSRSKNNYMGDYSVYVASTKRTLRGKWAIYYLYGDAKYTRGSPNVIDFNFKFSDFSGTVTSLKAGSQFVVRNQNEIRLPHFIVTSSNNTTYKTSKEVTFRRSGKRYIANVEVDDGLIGTSWVDYKHLVLEIVDNNDTDNDGIPDLSDNLAQPPAITSQPKSKEAKVGDSVTFSVSANGTAPLAYQWHKNGRVVPGATGRSYKITNLRKSHFGNYTVAVSNSAGSATSSSANLSEVIEIVPPSFTKHPDTITVPEGVTITLRGYVSGTAPIYYQWLKNDDEIIGATKSTYQITNAQTIHSGSYALIARNAGGETVSTAAIVQVAGKPINAFKSVRIVPDGVLLLYQVSPAQYYQIQASSDAVFSNFKILAQQNSTGLLEQLFVQNNRLATSTFFRIALTQPNYEKPVIAEAPTSKSIEEGDSVTFEVVAQSDTEASYKWFKNGELIIGQVGPILSIAESDFTDAGNYHVVVTNKGGSTVSEVTTLEVKEGGGPPVITQQPTPLKLSRNSSAILTVVVTGSKPFAYQWYKNGNKIKGETNSTYEIISASPAEHGGKVKVKITNKYGSVFSQEVLVSVSR
ncbi:immunoglobulin domain-containing protein, partial [bacterium]|nr:immunoglobulin domain-containing protein [bacterium]